MGNGSKAIVIAVSGLIVLITSLITINFYHNLQPIIIDETYGDSSIHITVSRDAILLPGECVNLKWELNHITQAQLIYHNRERAINGADSINYCIWSSNPAIKVNFSETESEIYPIHIQQKYTSIPELFLMLLAFASFSIFTYSLAGAQGVLIFVTAVCFTPILSTYTSTSFDFAAHIEWADQAQLSGNLQDLPPHFMFHSLTLTFEKLIPSIDIQMAAFLVVLLAQIGTVLGLYFLLISGRQDDLHRNRVYALFAFLLVWVGPISYFTRGFSAISETALIYANTYHSPTMLVMRSFSVWLFVLMIRAPQKWSNGVIVYCAGIAVLLLLSSFSKPNYTLVIVPAFFVLIGVKYLRDKTVSKVNLAIAGTLLIVAIIALGWQYISAFSTESTNVIADAESGIYFDFYGLYSRWYISPKIAFVEWLFSLLFPLSVYLIYRKQAWHNDTLNLAWIALAFAQAIIILFIEVPRTTAGNFVWGGRITALIVFAASVSFLLHQHDPKDEGFNWRFYLCIALFFVHVLFYTTILLRTFL